MIDVSYVNSLKNLENQLKVIDDIVVQMEDGEQCIVGVMIESYLVGGCQELVEGQLLVYGQSIIDGCIDWDIIVMVLE